MDNNDSPKLDSQATDKTAADTSATENKAAAKTESTAKAKTTASAKSADSAAGASAKSAKSSTKEAKATSSASKSTAAAKTTKDSKSAKKPAKKATAKTEDKAEGKSEKRPARKSSKAKAQAKVQKFRIRLTCFDHVLIDESTSNIVNTVKRTGANVCGPVPLPVRRHRYDLLRSPHKDKRSREQIEIREHCRLLDIVDISNKATSALANLDLPPGVHADIKVMKV